VSEPRPTEQADAEQGSVFGNLPDSRPGARSPRRDAAKKRAAGSGQRAKTHSNRAAPKPKAAPRPTAEPSGVGEPRKAREPSAADAGEAAESEPRTPEPDEGAGLEDLAWAGIAAAAEAATLGVRLASRAMEALRKPVDRR
jgi:hypothetical protein